MNELGIARLDDDRVFDLLADGELTEPERRELLASLDRRPDGWRRCALALLEAQAWREQFRPGATPTAPVPVIEPASQLQKSWSVTIGSSLVLAASALVAFSVGLFVNIKLPSSNQGDTMAASSEQQSSPQLQATSKTGNQSLANGLGERVITLAVAGEMGGEAKEIQLPLTEASNAAAVFDQPQPEFIRSLQDDGHEVTAYREFWPLRLRDGRTVVVPVDDVQVRFVGGDTF